MGNDLGTGIQGAVYRYQVTGYGGSLFTIMKEMTYVTSGTYTGKTAVSVILWFNGTLVLTVLTIYSLIKISRTDARQIRWLGIGLTITVLLYLGSCISQYGLSFLARRESVCRWESSCLVYSPVPCSIFCRDLILLDESG